jgi:hypothetical protein
MIASDDNNPNFSGAHNPDARLSVRFYRKPMKNEYESNEKSRDIFFDVDFVEIMVPGDSNTIIDTPVREEHKKRFPIHWARYQNSVAGEEQHIGTPLSSWAKLSPAQVAELKAIKFFTVDQVANASDAQIQKLGMSAGMSPYAFRDAALVFLKSADSNATASKASEAESRAKSLELQLAENNVKMAEMQAQLAQLLEGKSAGKLGRKPKATETIED